MKKPRKLIRLIKRSEYTTLNIPKVIACFKVYLVDTHRGFSHFRDGFVTVPLWTLSRGTNYSMYYIAHELSHILRIYKFGGNGQHDKRFYRCFRQICPIDLQHYELKYKPRGARLSKELNDK